MKKFNNITDITDNTKQNKLLISLPFLSKKASRYEKLVWTAKAIHILSKNDFVFNTENKETIGNLDKLLLKYFREKNIKKLELIKSDDKREKHFLEHNSLREFTILLAGFLRHFFPYVELLVQYNLFKKEEEYINYFNNLLNKETTVNLYYEVSLFQDYCDNPFIAEVIEKVYKYHAEYYYYYHVFIKDNKIHYQQKQIQNDTYFEKLKLSYFHSCISKIERREVRDIAYLDISEMLETRLQRLTIKQLKSEYFKLQRKSFEEYFEDVKNIFAKYQLLHPDFFEQNAFFFIKFLSAAKARYYQVHHHHLIQGVDDFHDQDINFEVEIQPQILLIGSESQGSGKSKFVEILFTNYIQNYICPSINIQRGASSLNIFDSRQQDIFFKNQKSNLFTYLGDVKSFNMDVLKDVMDKKKITYNIMHSDRSCTHNIALNFIMTMNANFRNSSLLKRIQTSDLGEQRRLLFLIASEKNLTKNENQEEKIKFDRLSQTIKFKEDMNYIMTHCPMGWDWMLGQNDCYISVVKKYNEIQNNLQKKQSPKKQHLEDLKDIFDFFQMEYVPIQCLYQVCKENHNYRKTHYAFGLFLNDLNIEQKRIRNTTLQNSIPSKRVIFKGVEHSLEEFIKSCINTTSVVRCRKNPFYDENNRLEDIPF